MRVTVTATRHKATVTVPPKVAAAAAPEGEAAPETAPTPAPEAKPAPKRA
jgi:hypothetical protein